MRTNQAHPSPTGRARVILATILGMIVATATIQTHYQVMSFLWGWDTAALVYLGWTGLTVFRMDPEMTAMQASSEDPDRVTADVIILLASLASLGAIILGLTQVSNAHGSVKILYISTCLLSVILSWALVHFTFTLKYARLFYNNGIRGLDFHGQGDPSYIDFAYVAFTVGMTFQVSDTDVSSAPMRRSILHHALLSYLFGTVFVATMINLIAGLMK